MVSMRTMRLAMMKENENEYRCCLCLHVRTGTVLLGMWHLVMQMMVLTMFATIALQPDYVHQSPNVSGAIKVYVNAFQNRDTDLNGDLFNAKPEAQAHMWSRDDRNVGVLISVCTLVLTLLLIYGSLKGRPGYLMPFFCLQVFDFCITCLSVVAYFSYMPNVKDWIQQQSDLPLKQELLRCGDWLMLLVILLFVLMMTVKAYFIGVVWACYKFLCRRHLEMAGGHLGHLPEGDMMEADTDMLLPPKYEDAVKFQAEYNNVNMAYPPPPPYSSDQQN